MIHEIDTVDGLQAVEVVGCDGCENINVRITDAGIAYSRNRYGTWTRHDCRLAGGF